VLKYLHRHAGTGEPRTLLKTYYCNINKLKIISVESLKYTAPQKYPFTLDISFHVSPAKPTPLLIAQPNKSCIKQ
jgi:hypothetical protein